MGVWENVSWERMKVLIVHPCKGFYGGAEEVVVQFCNYLSGDRHEVVLVSKDAPMEFGASNLCEASSYLRMWWMVRRYLEIDWPDVICCFNFPATLAVFPTKKPIIWYCNEPPELFTNWWRRPIEAFNRWWVRKSGMKCIVADEMQAFRFYRIYGVGPKVIPYGIDYRFWSQMDGGKEDKFTILQVGHSEFFSRGKKILEEIRGRIPEARLVQLSGKTHEEVREWYGRAHVLIHPIDTQGGWLVPFEAVSAGLPIIVSDRFTGASIIKNNNLGIVASIEAFPSVIEQGYELYTEGFYSKSNTKGVRRGWVKENLTWERFGESMVKVFKEALNARTDERFAKES